MNHRHFYFAALKWAVNNYESGFPLFFFFFFGKLFILIISFSQKKFLSHSLRNYLTKVQKKSPPRRVFLPANILPHQPLKQLNTVRLPNSPSYLLLTAEASYVHWTKKFIFQCERFFLVLCSCQPVCSPEYYGTLTISNDDKVIQYCLCLFLQEYAALAEAHLQCT